MIMDQKEIEELGVSTDLGTAAKALGISRGLAYNLANRDEFPVRVIRAGGRYIVPTAGLKELLGLAPTA